MIINLDFNTDFTNLNKRNIFSLLRISHLLCSAEVKQNCENYIRIYTITDKVCFFHHLSKIFHPEGITKLTRNHIERCFEIVSKNGSFHKLTFQNVAKINFIQSRAARTFRIASFQSGCRFGKTQQQPSGCVGAVTESQAVFAADQNTEQFVRRRVFVKRSEIETSNPKSCSNQEELFKPVEWLGLSSTLQPGTLQNYCCWRKQKVRRNEASHGNFNFDLKVKHVYLERNTRLQHLVVHERNNLRSRRKKQLLGRTEM